VIRVVVDPGVFISVLIGSRGSPPDRIFSAWIDDRLEVVASPQLIAELRRVLSRPRFRRWFDGTSAQQLVARLERHATMHAPKAPDSQSFPPSPPQNQPICSGNEESVETVGTKGAKTESDLTC
jgi:putative PIN family toxin of toxin-antitoxin system